jgi:AraC-like DNA-binding protein
LCFGRFGEISPVLAQFQSLFALVRQGEQIDGSWPLARVLAFIAQVYEQVWSAAAPRKDAVIERACRALARDPQAPISLMDVAEEAGMQYELFRKYFRSKMGMSPGIYRTQRRIAAAIKMLSEGRRVGEVAEALGYYDQYAFSKQFKLYTGISPREFKRNSSSSQL